MDRRDRERMLRLRSWRRGTKEMDLLLGAFADAKLDSLDAASLGQYESLLELDDPTVFDMLFGRIGCGANVAIVARIRDHHGIEEEGGTR